MITRFPDFVPIALEHRAELAAYLAAHPPLASEYTFTNLFAWDDTYHFRIAAYDSGYMIVKGEGEKLALLQPLVPGDKRRAVLDGLAYLADHTSTPRIDRVGEDFLAGEDWQGWPVQVAEDRDNADYVYSVPELIELKGDKYHDKKNLLHQFERAYPEAEFLPLTSELIGKALLFQHEWCDDRECAKNVGLHQENCAVFRMMMHFEALNITGGVIAVDGRFVALTIAEQLNPETVVIHVEKGRSKMTGIYQAINQRFLAHGAAGYPLVNREQDLGVPGLRKAKQSYNPVQLVMKYSITPSL